VNIVKKSAHPNVVMIIAIMATKVAAAQAQPARDDPAGHTVQLARWYAFYADLSITAPQTPVIPSSEPVPTLRAKYDRLISAPGLAAFAGQSFTRMMANLSPGDYAPIRNVGFVMSNCAISGPALLTSWSPVRRTVCVAPILISGVFLESASADMERLSVQLAPLQITLGSLNTAYDQRLNSRGITRADWSAMLAGNEPEWARFQQSVDYLSAYLLYCTVLGHPVLKCSPEAAMLVSRVDGTSDNSAIRAVLASATDRYDPASWGFAKAGDADEVGRAFVRVSP
jgi:hypothetical protein